MSGSVSMAKTILQEGTVEGTSSIWKKKSNTGTSNNLLPKLPKRERMNTFPCQSNFPWRLLGRVSSFCTKYEPAHDKTYNKTFVTRKDSDQPIYIYIYIPSRTTVLVYSSGQSWCCSRHIRSAKTLIRLRGCAGWSESSLVAQVLL